MVINTNRLNEQVAENVPPIYSYIWPVFIEHLRYTKHYAGV